MGESSKEPFHREKHEIFVPEDDAQNDVVRYGSYVTLSIPDPDAELYVGTLKPLCEKFRVMER